MAESWPASQALRLRATVSIDPGFGVVGPVTMRLDYTTVAPEGIAKIFGLGAYISNHAQLDHKLAHLIELRASQINGCAFCLHMHTLQLQQAGEEQVRIDALSAWDETDLFTDKERAALAWTEALTKISETHAPDSNYDELKRHFSDREIADLTLAITAINTWNRLAIGFRIDPRTAPAVIAQLGGTRQPTAV